jgi:hypothetical protein
MGQQSMVAKIYADHSEEVNTRDKKCDANPTEKPGHEHQQRKQVNHDQPRYSGPVEFSCAGFIIVSRQRDLRPFCVSLRLVDH